MVAPHMSAVGGWYGG